MLCSQSLRRVTDYEVKSDFSKSIAEEELLHAEMFLIECGKIFIVIRVFFVNGLVEFFLIQYGFCIKYENQ